MTSRAAARFGWVIGRVASSSARSVAHRIYGLRPRPGRTGGEPLDGSYGLPDPDDEHVVAAAVVGGAGVIVTGNGKDFPEDLVPGHIQVVSPAQFAADTDAVSPTAARRAVETMATRLNNPPVTVGEVLALPYCLTSRCARGALR
ncbi:hypothetical protein [Rhodococcus sp. PSBB049]|uniref:hypothetical protein n=1 Tax=Rhodococcus sp. PSBB049 TaxID=2812863 RepID=UPI0019820B87|nr:hypothetical protein [Rhodococcus sp. PSBB049]QSE72303.1 hypothetical protein JYA91_28525 [Rhodococcus sp. PSBB049]